MNCFDEDSKKSARTFETITAPALKKLLGATAIISTENHDNELATALDRESGIDAVIISPKFGVVPIASRVQYNKPYRGFSVRRSRQSGSLTEYDKLRRADDKQTGLKPIFHVATFVDGESAQIGITRTTSLLKIIDKGYVKPQFYQNGDFFAISWQDLQQRGYDVRIINVRADHADKGDDSQ